MEEDLVRAVQAMNCFPPIIVAHGIGGFVAQKYLESFPASALVLVDAFPPYPEACAQRALDNSTAADLAANEDLLHELLDPENDVFLEPMSVRMLMVGTSVIESSNSSVMPIDLQAAASFHGVEQDDVAVLSAAGPVFIEGNESVDHVLAERVHEWVDIYF
jgi:pimeloyl-ACP methyl ester carboxylesterase